MPQSAQAPVAPREAASLVLVREARDGLEALLLQRHPGSRFSPGAFAFPGGRVEPADAASGVERWSRLQPDEAARRLAAVPPVERALAFWIAALREAFEEAGLLLAWQADGGPVSPATVAVARARRPQCRRDAAAFARMLAELGLVLATDGLAYWAHWITPEERPIRYDTRFFLAAAFSGQAPEPDELEVVGARWLPPDEALRQHRAGTLLLPFPTQRIVASLAGHRDVGALLAAARAREPEVRPVRPRVLGPAGEERILVPGDPGWF